MRLPISPARWRAMVVAVFVAVAGAYSALTPVWEAPDEPAHFDYVVHLRAARALPDQRVDPIETSHHPPLYYALAALASLPADLSDRSGAFRLNPRFTWAGGAGDQPGIHLHSSAETFPWTGVALALHLARFLSVALSAGAVWLTASLGDALFPRRPHIGLLAAALVAANPQFVFISGAALNDSLLNLAGTGALVWIARAAGQSGDAVAWRRAWAVAGVWVAVAALAKVNGVVFAVIAGAALAAVAVWRRSTALFARGAMALGLPGSMLAGWWFIRNQWLYGDILGSSVWEQRFPQAIRAAAPDLGAVLREQFLSFWARFGWMNVGLPGEAYAVVGAVCGLAVAGLAVYVARLATGRAPAMRIGLAGVLFCLGCVAVQEVLLIRENFRFTTAAQGRYLFPVIAPLMVAFSVGLDALLPARAARVAPSVVSAVGAASALFVLSVVIVPAYPMRTLPKLALLSVPARVEADFGGTFGLRGYGVEPAGASGNLRLKLYWIALAEPPFDYSSFAHLISTAGGPDGPAIAQADQAPGDSAAYPPSRWSRGDIVLDERIIKVDRALPAGDYALRVGVYDAATGRRLPVARGDSANSDFVVLPARLPPK